MTNVAIIGKDSYIGGHIAVALREKGFSVVEVDALDDRWADFDFTTVDTVIHVAAIVHRKDIADPAVYENVNVKLPLAVVERAAAAGVLQFVFMSSMAVYGRGHVLQDCCIVPDSPLCPKTEYAKSKLQAEQALQQSIDSSMVLSIVRPPSVYGRGCKGNLFYRYEKIASLLPRIPACEPDCLQGLLYIDNLCSAIYAIINDRKAGCFHPQDSSLLTMTEILCEIQRCRSGKSYVSDALGRLVSLFSFMPVYQKLFGAVYYADCFAEQEALSSSILTTREGLRRMYGETH